MLQIFIQIQLNYPLGLFVYSTNKSNPLDKIKFKRTFESGLPRLRLLEGYQKRRIQKVSLFVWKWVENNKA